HCRRGSLAQRSGESSSARRCREFGRERVICHETPIMFRQASGIWTDLAMQGPETAVLKQQPAPVYVSSGSAVQFGKRDEFFLVGGNHALNVILKPRLLVT